MTATANIQDLTTALDILRQAHKILKANRVVGNGVGIPLSHTSSAIREVERLIDKEGKR